ncbi:hypothetical protein [Saccharicrinis aurantiacus]|uniref:hypothetical protein n=1 Tax=Saccharicrinis aurantiacus TaxID=1849719 RepID=UPI0024931CE5|nr:hypothetical protein [Saccharicrinis aurantiacus]
MAKILHLISIILLLSQNSFSQETTVVTYNAFNSEETLNKESIKQYKNALNTNLFLLPRGTFIINYERALNNYFTFEIGAGLTHKDYLYNFDLDDMSNDTNTEYKIAYAYNASIKFFPKEQYDLEGFYISPYYRYRKHTETYNSVDVENNEYSANNDMIVQETALLFGYSALSYSDVLFDYYIGIGYRNRNYTQFSYNDNNTGGLVAQDINEGTPTILLGLKIGFNF